MILETYAGPRDEVLAETILVRLRNPVFKEDNKTVFPHLSHIFGTTVLWFHAKCAFNNRYGILAYKRIFSHLFCNIALENRDAACDTVITKIEYHGEK